MNISAFLEPEALGARKARYKGWNIRLGQALRGDPGSAATILAISSEGFLFQSSAKLKIGHRITLFVSDGEAFRASIGWANEPLYSCKFVQSPSETELHALRSFAKPQGSLELAANQADVDVPESLHARLRRLRKQHGLTLEAMSEQAGVSEPTIWAWETGRTVPRTSNLQVLAKIFSLSEQELLYGPSVARTTLVKRPFTAQLSSLEMIVTKCRKEIAQAAGVEISKVQINITL